MRVQLVTECTMYRTYFCEIPDDTPIDAIHDAVTSAPKVHMGELDDVDDDEESVSVNRLNESEEAVEPPLWVSPFGGFVREEPNATD